MDDITGAPDHYDIGNRKIHESVVWPEIPEE
jgi:hypothetical protein